MSFIRPIAQGVCELLAQKADKEVSLQALKYKESFLPWCLNWSQHVLFAVSCVFWALGHLWASKDPHRHLRNWSRGALAEG